MSDRVRKAHRYIDKTIDRAIKESPHLKSGLEMLRGALKGVVTVPTPPRQKTLKGINMSLAAMSDSEVYAFHSILVGIRDGFSVEVRRKGRNIVVTLLK